MTEIIKEKEIFDILKKYQTPTREEVKETIDKAKNKKGLTLVETAILLNNSQPDLIDEMFRAAKQVKQDIYGSRLVLFAPLYVSSFCVNDCEYCGFHRRNPAVRKKLSLEEIKQQVEILLDRGYKRLLLEFGEDINNNPIDYVVEVIKTIYNTKKGKGDIRRVNVNIAATSIENYKKLKTAGIGTYQLFQETYHRPTYEQLHNGPKADYERQLTALDRALQAGLDDVGIGVLFGLYNYKFEVLGLLTHAQYLDKKYKVGPHTISVPRFRPAHTVDYQPTYEVSDDDFLKIIAVLRLAVPYTGMIISTRENPEIRKKAFAIGISQTSAGSATSPGGYGQEKAEAQFNIADHRSLDEVIYDICQMDYLPSFCTACYRSQRTGEKFMELAKTGNINLLCQPNAILTFKEYLLDYASPQTKEAGEKLIEKTIAEIPDEKVREQVKNKLKELVGGKRDLYF